MFGVEIDAMRLEQAVDRIAQWVAEPFSHCRYVVTPSVDHIVMLQHDHAFRRSYRKADLVLADGWPVVMASKWIGKPLPGLVPGSDLTPALLATWKVLSLCERCCWERCRAWLKWRRRTSSPNGPTSPSPISTVRRWALSTTSRRAVGLSTASMQRHQMC